jgi:hypothetical protein
MMSPLIALRHAMSPSTEPPSETTARSGRAPARNGITPPIVPAMRQSACKVGQGSFAGPTTPSETRMQKITDPRTLDSATTAARNEHPSSRPQKPLRREISDSRTFGAPQSSTTMSTASNGASSVRTRLAIDMEGLARELAYVRATRSPCSDCPSGANSGDMRAPRPAQCRRWPAVDPGGPEIDPAHWPKRRSRGFLRSRPTGARQSPETAQWCGRANLPRASATNHGKPCSPWKTSRNRLTV